MASVGAFFGFLLAGAGTGAFVILVVSVTYETIGSLIPILGGGLLLFAGAIGAHVVLMAMAYLGAYVVQASVAAVIPMALVYTGALILTGVVALASSAVATQSSEASLPAMVLVAAAFGLCLLAGRVTAVTIGYVVASILVSVGSPGEPFARGLLIGANTWGNMFGGALVYGPLLYVAFGPALLPLMIATLASVVLLLGVVTFLAAVAPSDVTVKGALGWMAWLMPTAWATNMWGWLLFYLNHVLHLFSFLPGPLARDLAIAAVEVRSGTGTIITDGGGIANANLINTAYDVGTFVFVDRMTTPDAAPQRRLHEIGHHLNLAAFGTAFGVVGGFDELVLGVLGRLGVGPGGIYAYSEQLAEGNVTPPRPGRQRVAMW